MVARECGFVTNCDDPTRPKRKSLKANAAVRRAKKRHDETHRCLFERGVAIGRPSIIARDVVDGHDMFAGERGVSTCSESTMTVMLALCAPRISDTASLTMSSISRRPLPGHPAGPRSMAIGRRETATRKHSIQRSCSPQPSLCLLFSGNRGGLARPAQGILA